MTPVEQPSVNKPSKTSQAGDATPEIWALTSYRAGETSQILALAGALADTTQHAWRRIDIDYQPWASVAGFLRLTTAIGALVPPGGTWPTLLISAGLRNEPICRWVKRRSGGRTRIVFLGRTWAAASHFDLVVTTPQYRLRPAANIVENPLTLHRIGPAVLDQARRSFASRLAADQQQLVGVLLGGDSGPYRFDSTYARRLASELNDFARVENARLLVSSSSRTPPEFFAELAQLLADEHEIHDWRSNEPNPYLGILACAEKLIVSADSIAMVSEAVATGKPVLLSEPSCAASPGAWLYHSATSWGHRRWTRNVALVHQTLSQLGLATWFGQQPATGGTAEAGSRRPDGIRHPTGAEGASISCLEPTVKLICERFL